MLFRFKEVASSYSLCFKIEIINMEWTKKKKRTKYNHQLIITKLMFYVSTIDEIQMEKSNDRLVVTIL